MRPLRDEVPPVARVLSDVRRQVVGARNGRRRSGRSRPTARARSSGRCGARDRRPRSGSAAAAPAAGAPSPSHVEVARRGVTPGRRQQPGQHLSASSVHRRAAPGTTARRRSRRSRGAAGRRGRHRASTRPPLRWSRVVRCLATTAGPTARQRRDHGADPDPRGLRRDRAEQHPGVVDVEPSRPSGGGPRGRTRPTRWPRLGARGRRSRPGR